MPMAILILTPLGIIGLWQIPLDAVTAIYSMFKMGHVGDEYMQPFNHKDKNLSISDLIFQFAYCIQYFAIRMVGRYK